jgi:hypothetical protein
VQQRAVPPAAESVESVTARLPATGRTADAVALGRPEAFGSTDVVWLPPGATMTDVERSDEFLRRSQLHLATPDLLDLLGLPADAVADDEVLFFSRSLYAQAPNADQSIRIVSYGWVGRTAQSETSPLIAKASDIPAIPGIRALVSASTADQLGMDEVGRSVALELQRPPTATEARAVAERFGSLGWVDTRREQPFWETPMGTALFTGAGALVVALVVTIVAGMTAALAATESDDDLRKVVAFGGHPRMRRSFHGVQAWWHAMIAGVLGTGLGIVIALVALDSSNLHIHPRIWPAAAAWLLIMPVIVGAVIALFLRSSVVEAPRRRMA